jgi:hypothetical protein
LGLKRPFVNFVWPKETTIRLRFEPLAPGWLGSAPIQLRNS